VLLYVQRIPGACIPWIKRTWRENDRLVQKLKNELRYNSTPYIRLPGVDKNSFVFISACSRCGLYLKNGNVSEAICAYIFRLKYPVSVK